MHDQMMSLMTSYQGNLKLPEILQTALENKLFGDVTLLVTKVYGVTLATST